MRGSEASHCFTGLSPDTDHSVTVFVQTPNLEGPGVSVREHTSKFSNHLERLRKSSEKAAGVGDLGGSVRLFSPWAAVMVGWWQVPEGGSLAGLGPVSAANPCCPCYRVSVILREGLKNGGTAAADSEKQKDPCSWPVLAGRCLTAFLLPVALGPALCSWSVVNDTHDTEFGRRGIPGTSVPVRHDSLPKA